jgi:hypothetical protein
VDYLMETYANVSAPWRARVLPVPAHGTLTRRWSNSAPFCDSASDFVECVPESRSRATRIASADENSFAQQYQQYQGTGTNQERGYVLQRMRGDGHATIRSAGALRARDQSWLSVTTSKRTGGMAETNGELACLRGARPLERRLAVGAESRGDRACRPTPRHVSCHARCSEHWLSYPPQILVNAFLKFMEDVSDAEFSKTHFAEYSAKSGAQQLLITARAFLSPAELAGCATARQASPRRKRTPS